MKKHIVNILSIRQMSHDVRSYRTEKPKGFSFIPGQAVNVSINKPEWKNERRPFTLTSLNEEATLEFTIKSYTDRHSVTDELYRLRPGNRLILHDVWGTIAYRGPGYFIAGGAGITPFIAIFRQLHRENKLAGNILFFSNKTSRDVIFQHELTRILRKDVVYLLSKKESIPGYITGHIDEAFLRERVDDFSKQFYICGPGMMVQAISEILLKRGVSPDNIVFEK